MPAGRPSKYVKRYAKEATYLCRMGATLENVAEFFDVSVTAIKEWGEKHPEFATALKARMTADEIVEHSLFRKATGFSVDDTHFATCDGKIISQTYTKHYPPDTTAQIFWLKNRQPGKWRDKQEFGVTDTAGNDAQIIVNLGAQIAQQMRKKQ